MTINNEIEGAVTNKEPQQTKQRGFFERDQGRDHRGKRPPLESFQSKAQ